MLMEGKLETKNAPVSRRDGSVKMVEVECSNLGKNGQRTARSMDLARFHSKQNS